MPDRIALIIANGDFDDTKLSRLNTPTHDAKELAEVLSDPGIGDFDVTLLVDEPERVVRRRIAQLYYRRKRSDLLLLYYSGHGIRDAHGDLHLATKDTEVDLLGATALNAAFVREQIDKSNSKRKVVILDCSHSGAFAGAKAVLPGAAIITSSDALELAWEGDGEERLSLFTKHLVEGLRTGAADLDSDGKISLDELYDYVYERVPEEHAGQTPRKWMQNVQGQIFIAHNPHTVVGSTNAEKVAETLVEEEVLEVPVDTGIYQIATRALADKPSDVDLLGFSDYADALADFIRNENTSKPLTIGIDAPWGMGKTTLMRMMQERLSGQNGDKHEDSFPTVWFNAWKYDQEESLWAALALEILSRIRQRFNVWQRIRFWAKLNWSRFDWGQLLRSVLRSLAYVFAIGLLGGLALGAASLGFGVTAKKASEVFIHYTKAVGGLGVVAALYAVGKEAYDRIADPFDLKIAEYVREPDYRERVGFLAQFEADFKRVISAITDKGKWPLVVFIDDLDRCAPPKPVEIIEAINILLDAKHCVFIIGMDAPTVAVSIEARYGDLRECLVNQDTPGDLTLGQRFLEKIIQISFRIPKVKPAVIDSFVDANLDKFQPELDKGLPKEETAEAEELIKAEQRSGQSLDDAAQKVRTSRPEIPGQVIEEAKKEVFAHSFDDSIEVREAVKSAVPYLDFNPRKIKRFINLFRLQALIANRRGLLDEDVVDLGLLAKWIVIETRWPDMVEGMMDNKVFIEHLQRAHKIQGRLLKDENEPEQKQQLQVTLDTLFADPRIERLVDAADLFKLLEGMTDSEFGSLPHYLHLARVTGSGNRSTAKTEKEYNGQSEKSEKQLPDETV
jgi:hypothetical protein